MIHYTLYIDLLSFDQTFWCFTWMLWDTLHWRFTTGGREQREQREQPPRPLSFLWWLHDQFFTSTGSSGLNLMQVAFVEFCIQNGQDMTRKCPIRLWILCFGLVDPFWGNVLILTKYTKWRAHFQHFSTHWDHPDPFRSVDIDASALRPGGRYRLCIDIDGSDSQAQQIARSRLPICPW